jgi:hypothetical protein
MKKRQLNNYIRQFEKIWGKKKSPDRLSEIITFKYCLNEESQSIKTEMGYVSPSNIFFIVPKTEEIKNLMEEVSPLENYKKKFEVKKFNHRSGEMEIDYYSGKILSFLLTLFKYSNTIKVELKDEFPIWIEDENLVVILAPQRYQKRNPPIKNLLEDKYLKND